MVSLAVLSCTGKAPPGWTVIHHKQKREEGKD